MCVFAWIKTNCSDKIKTKRVNKYMLADDIKRSLFTLLV